MGKTTPPDKGVSAGKKGKYRRTKKHRAEAKDRATRQRAENPTTPAQSAASAENGAQGGAPTKYKPEYCQRLRDYFNIDETRTRVKTIETKGGAIITEEIEYGNLLPTLSGFCRSIDVSRSTLQRWADAHPDFHEAVEVAKTHQERILLANGLLGHYAQPFAVLFAKTNLGYVERVALQGGGEGAPPVEVSVEEIEKRREASRKRMDAVLKRVLPQTKVA